MSAVPPVGQPGQRPHDVQLVADAVPADHLLGPDAGGGRVPQEHPGDERAVPRLGVELVVEVGVEDLGDLVPLLGVPLRSVVPRVRGQPVSSTATRDRPPRRVPPPGAATGAAGRGRPGGAGPPHGLPVHEMVRRDGELPCRRRRSAPRPARTRRPRGARSRIRETPGLVAARSRTSGGRAPRRRACRGLRRGVGLGERGSGRPAHRLDDHGVAMAGEQAVERAALLDIEDTPLRACITDVQTCP